ncbi:tRNA (guanine(37)-N1)-methyltransferase 1 [Canna indica]|uniref:tRNA (guanine(37)-N1)-methyltransferase n=1 Tax=Canna indica TaxID=4628 RepID=A0AAQ3QA01_9LILI|nr:tRNA (guanine(37)-N1)-methyltransferase 1 [Canna indica]
MNSLCCHSMAALRTHIPLPSPLSVSSSPRRLFSKTFSSSFSSSNAVLNLAAEHYGSLLFQYGPSLRRGRPPETPPSEESGAGVASPGFIDRTNFSRVFDVAALRVPAEECSTLEHRLRGHLLNWPRVRNVARVPGDDVDPELRRMLRDAQGDGGARLDSLAARADGKPVGEMSTLCPVLYREKLVKEFNCRGYLKFRNLAKMSRPKKKKVKSKEAVDRESKRIRKNEFATVQVVGEVEEEDEEDLSGLLGDDFRRLRWRGPTRLLLLDEQYATKGVDELPEAIKAVLHDHTCQSRLSAFELVQCQVTLSYDYWQMNELLEALLPEGIIVPSGFETVGHIAHLNLKDEHLPYKKLIAQVVLDKNRPKIQTVVNKIDAIQNDYRTMQLEVLAGNHSLVTTVVENGIRFQVDLGTVYWNSKLATERQRLISTFTSSDVVCDVFSGVGPIAISAAKKVKYVFANDLNPNAVEYLERNIVVNKLERKVEVFNMEGRRFIIAMFASQRPYSITQVVMNLPNDGAEFLDAFQGIFRNRPRAGCTMPKIHVYGFSKAQNPEYDFQERINVVLCKEAVDVETHRVRLVAPGKWMLCASFVLPEGVAFEEKAVYTL